jgi:hypothetical protein
MNDLSLPSNGAAAISPSPDFSAHFLSADGHRSKWEKQFSHLLPFGMPLLVYRKAVYQWEVGKRTRGPDQFRRSSQVGQSTTLINV